MVDLVVHYIEFANIRPLNMVLIFMRVFYSWFYRLVSFYTTVKTTWLESPWSIKWYNKSICPYSTTKYGLDIDALFIVGFTGWLFFHRGQNHLVRKTMVD